MVKRYIVFLACLYASLVSFSCGTDSAVRKNKAETSKRLGEGYLAERNIASALAEFLKAEKLYNKDPFLYYDLGLAYFAKGEFELAISHFKKAVALKSDYSEAFNAMGSVYLRLEQWDNAISCFNRAHANLLYATPHFALSNLGEAYRGKKDYPGAINFYRKAIEASPRFPTAYRGLGLAYMAVGNYTAAASCLEKAVRYAPRFAVAYYDLGHAYAGQYDIKKAVSSFQKVAELAPDSPLAETALAEIKKLTAK
ncbi:MAG: tetratricopeptide repeat protein [Desulfobacterales bacterium]|nr:tetratricopeptide repeat protein [Desulfobacterales bacterium]